MSHLDDGLLNALLDNELDEAERRAAESHLADCPECRRQFEEARGFAGEADRLVALVEVPPGRKPGSVPGTAPGGSTGWPWPRWRALAWAATVVLAAGFGWFASGVQRSAGDGVRDERYVKESRREESKPADPAPQPAAVPAPREGATPLAEREPRRRQERLDRPVAQTGVAPALAAADALKDRDSASTVTGQIALRGNREEVAKQSVDGAPGAPTASFGNAAAAEAPAPGRAAAALKATAAEFRTVGMEEAVRTLEGSIRLVDGLEPKRILNGPGSTMPGADTSRPVIRVVYEDPPGRELWLDQQRPATEDDRAFRAKARNLLPGDTVMTSIRGGMHGVRWIDQHGFRLALTGFLQGDSLRAIIARVH